MQKIFFRLAVYFFLAALVLIFYSSTLSNGFVHDDVWQVATNQSIQGGNLKKVFSGCIAEELLGGCENRGFYWRPMQGLFYLLTYQISPAPWAFHLVNLVLFWAAGVLVFLLIDSFTSSKYKVQSAKLQFKVKKSNVSGQLLIVRGVPFIAAVIFLAHPINSEVVNWISASPEILATIFTLLSLIFFIKYLNLSFPPSIKSRMTLGASALFFFLALLSKETAAFYFLLLPILMLIVCECKFREWMRISKSLLVYLLPLVVYIIARSAVLGRVVYKYEGYYQLSIGEQILTALALLPRYLLKLIWPLPLSFQPLVEPIRGVNWEVILGVGILVGLGLGVILIFAHARGVKAHLGGVALRTIAFGLFLILLGILPSLVFVNKLGEFLFSERYLFFSTVGLGILVAGIASVIPNLIRDPEKMLKRVQHDNVVAIRVTVAIIGLSLLFGSWFVIYKRNYDWRDNFSSYQAMLRIDPQNKRAHWQLGLVYQASGELELARRQYQTALAIDPDYVEARQSLAAVANRYNNSGLSFYYPENWQIVEKTDKSIHLTDSERRFFAEFSVNILQFTVEDYLTRQKDNHGELVNEGPAQIPNVEQAWVKVWSKPIELIDTDLTDSAKLGQNQQNQVLLQFFLFGKEKVVEILVWPADSPQMKVFDGILGSIQVAD